MNNFEYVMDLNDAEICARSMPIDSLVREFVLLKKKNESLLGKINSLIKEITDLRIKEMEMRTRNIHGLTHEEYKELVEWRRGQERGNNG